MNAEALFEDAKPPASQPMADALKSQLASNPRKILLVASEGGGIRAAYWTALVLAELHDREQASPGTVGQAIVLSGVSGGAFGEAVYIACLRESGKEGSI